MSARSWLLALGTTALLAGCQVAQPKASLSPARTPTFAPTATTAPTTPAPELTTAAPTQNSQTTSDPCAASSGNDPAKPPDAYVSATGNDPLKGNVGSFTYCNLAADALPPRAQNVDAVALGSSGTVILSVPAGEGFVAFRAAYWAASEWQGDEISLDSGSSSEPAKQAEVDAPPAGDWMLAVHLTFASGGNAVYYWHVTVP